eukprot:6005859-Lingulodinium_polyedra.AAC.1
MKEGDNAMVGITRRGRIGLRCPPMAKSTAEVRKLANAHQSLVNRSSIVAQSSLGNRWSTVGRALVNR